MGDERVFYLFGVVAKLTGSLPKFAAVFLGIDQVKFKVLVCVKIFLHFINTSNFPIF